MMDFKTLWRIIRTTRWRLRLQRALERLTTTSMLAVATLLIGLYYYKTRALGPAEMWVFYALAAAWVATGLFWGLMAKFPAKAVAGRLDEANGLHNALSSALEFTDQIKSAPQSVQPFMELEIRRAMKVLPAARASKAAPFRWPRDIRPLSVLLAAAIGFAAVEIPSGHARVVQVVKKDKQGDIIKVPDEVIDEIRDELKDLEEQAKKLNDEEQKKFLDEQKKLLDQLKKGEITREEFMKRYAELMERYFPGEREIAKRYSEINDLLSKSADAFLKHKNLKKLGEALKRGDFNKAREEIKKLLEKMKQNKMSKREKKLLQKALKKMAEKMRQDKLAKKIEKRIVDQKAKLQEKINKTEKQIRRLQQLMRRKPSAQVQKQLNRMKRKQQAQRKQMRRMGQQQRQLRQLQKKQQGKGQKKPGGGQKMDPKLQAELRKLMRQLQRYQNQAGRSNSRSQARTSLRDLKELLKRLRNQQGRKKGRLKDFLNRARGKGGRGKPGGGMKPGGTRPGKTGGGMRPGGRRPGGLKRGGNMPGGQKRGQGGKKWGTGRGGDPRGRKTSIDSSHHEKFVKGEKGEGDSAEEIVSGAADKGFSTTGYRRLYVRYRKLRKEIIQEEDIPPGYRYYIKRYFKLIRPRRK